MFKKRVIKSQSTFEEPEAPAIQSVEDQGRYLNVQSVSRGRMVHQKSSESYDSTMSATSMRSSSADSDARAASGKIELINSKKNGTVDTKDAPEGSTMKGVWRRAFFSLKKDKGGKRMSISKKKESKAESPQEVTKEESEEVDPVYNLLRYAATKAQSPIAGGTCPTTRRPESGGSSPASANMSNVKGEKSPTHKAHKSSGGSTTSPNQGKTLSTPNQGTSLSPASPNQARSNPYQENTFFPTIPNEAKPVSPASPKSVPLKNPNQQKVVSPAKPPKGKSLSQK